MIIEMLFMGVESKSTSNSCQMQPFARKYTVIEENAIYYAAGYVLRKLTKKYHEADGEKETTLLSTVTSMIGDSSSFEATSSYVDYVKTWTQQVDRGGLTHVTDDTYRLFCSIETITYELLSQGAKKDTIISSVMGDKTVCFHWYLLVGDLKEEWSSQLLLDVVTLWFTLRGFSITSKVLETYKVGQKKNIKGTKAFRKELH